MRASIFLGSLISVALGCARVDYPGGCDLDESLCSTPDATSDSDEVAIDTGAAETPSEAGDDVGEDSLDAALDTAEEADVTDATDSGADTADTSIADSGSDTPDVGDACTPITSCPAGKVCGSISNGCGGTVSCGTCSGGKTCTSSNACGCTPNAYYCAGATLQKCATDGSDYATVTTCPSAATCDATLGRCTSCTPGSYYCVGADRYSCSTLGVGSKVATCTNDALCAAGSGASCGTPVCTTGEKTCSGKTARTCNATLTGWNDTTCEIGCSAGACLEVVDLAAGASHVCAVLSDGTARCWGYNNNGQAGGTGAFFQKATAVAGVTNAVQIATGNFTSGVRRSDGTLMWWGLVPSSDSAESSIAPTAIGGVSGAVDFALGRSHGCARFASGPVKCWGRNGSGQLGNGTIVSSLAPSIVTTSTGLSSTASATTIVLGTNSSFALGGGEVLGWGANNYGQLGDGYTTSYETQPLLTSFTYATQISMAALTTCARISDGTVKCAGYNQDGQLGNGTSGGSAGSATPVPVTGITNAVQVSVGLSHACAVLSDGTVRCWGSNTSGQLGNGSSGAGTSSSVPVTVPSAGVSGATKVIAFNVTSCALIGKTTIKCWGGNGGGQLGADLDPTTVTLKVVPTAVVW